MPASHHIDNNNKIIVTVWEGEANDADFIDAMKKYQDEVQCKPEYIHYNEILDFSKVTNVNVTIDGVKRQTR